MDCNDHCYIMELAPVKGNSCSVFPPTYSLWMSSCCLLSVSKEINSHVALCSLFCYPSLLLMIYIMKKPWVRGKNNFLPFHLQGNIFECTVWVSMILRFQYWQCIKWEVEFRGHSTGSIREYWHVQCVSICPCQTRMGRFKEGWTAQSVHTEINRYPRELSTEWESYRKQKE